MWLLLLGVFSCSPSNEGVPPAQAPPAVEQAPPQAEVVEPKAATGEAATVDLTLGEGWGAVFWRDGVASRSGGGDGLLGPAGAGSAKLTGASGPCGAVLEGAPARAAVALPAGKTPPTLPESPATRADLVERAAWRLDEVLPPRDRFSPAIESPDPALQRGVRVASVAKTRRTGAPPVLLSSGARDCVGVVAALDQEASKTLSWDQIPELCEPLSLLPAADLDGDGAREVVGYSEARVMLWRIEEKPGVFRLIRAGDWRCEDSAK